MAGEQERTLKALEAAIQMEVDGKKFYTEAAGKSNNELGKKLLLKLADEEDVHRQMFEKIYESISESRGWSDHDLHSGSSVKTIFAEAVASMDKNIKMMPDEISAVETAMNMENKTYDFYEEQLKKAGSEAEKKFYKELAAQEKEHHKVLLDYFEFLKDPAAWFVLKEHPSIDGG